MARSTPGQPAVRCARRNGSRIRGRAIRSDRRQRCRWWISHNSGSASSRPSLARCGDGGGVGRRKRLPHFGVRVVGVLLERDAESPLAQARPVGLQRGASPWIRYQTPLRFARWLEVLERAAGFALGQRQERFEPLARRWAGCCGPPTGLWSQPGRRRSARRAYGLLLGNDAGRRSKQRLGGRSAG